ncbi:restriction endonuclease subunit S [Sinorhizobium mexicanum]|uniref:Uncharacterized protein n=1 Tax=Sinorhizobium mexicanum TaxID=375549 RepID=A0A859QDN6_9HYPH|nr:restriction endonuclease subunit S [Sinorhizobium mexicanum]MBP1885711.1 hypothetical protein [Sinorhizobium mexicanum]QLL63483.1 hypothetical protein FKV68_19565 [Sinorhizobium mexicanum]
MPTKKYDLLGMRSNIGGPFLRESKFGSEISANSLNKVQKGDFIYSRLFAWQGSFGEIPDNLSGCFVSNEFPIFCVDRSRVDPKFLTYWFGLPSTQSRVERDCYGSTPGTRNRFKEEFFYELQAPLPSLDEQAKIVQRLDSTRAKLNEVRALKIQQEKELSSLVFALLNGPKSSPYRRIAFGEVATHRSPDTVVRPDVEYCFAGVYSFGKGVFVGDKKVGSEFSYDRLTQIRSGDFLYPKLMAWEGALGVVPTSCDGLFVSPEFPVFSLNEERILPQVVDAYFRHPATWPNLDASSKGTNLRRRRLHPSAILQHQIPLPPYEVQNAVAKLLTEHGLSPKPHYDSDLEVLFPAMLHQIFERQGVEPKTVHTVSKPSVVDFPQLQTTAIDAPFKEAVLVSAIVKAFYQDGGQPIGNFRLQKAVYFARRHMGESALDKDYLRKAAGPYNPSMRYSGGIKIATDKEWIKRATGRFGEGHALSSVAAEMDEWIERYQFAAAAAWVRDRFKFKSNDIWETLATIDYAMLALDHRGTRPSPASILTYIEGDDEWRPKIGKLRLTEASIQNAMVELQNLFPVEDSGTLK